MDIILNKCCLYIVQDHIILNTCSLCIVRSGHSKMASFSKYLPVYVLFNFRSNFAGFNCSKLQSCENYLTCLRIFIIWSM